MVFASGPQALNPELADRVAELYPELPLYVVSEFAPRRGEWIPYHPYRSFRENMAACRDALRGKRVRLSAALLVPGMPYRRMRLMALLLSPRRFLAYNENLDSFMLRPRSAPAIARHMVWRAANFARWHAGKEGPWRKDPAGRLGRWAAVVSGALAAQVRPVSRFPAMPERKLTPGISVVAPAGMDVRALRAEKPDELIFAERTQMGVSRARFSHVLVVSEGAAVWPGLLKQLHRAFDEVPGLFGATVRPGRSLAGEGLTYTLQGGGCGLFDTAKLRALGGLPGAGGDLGCAYRAWLRGWPSVFGAEWEFGEPVAGDELRFAASLGSGRMWKRALERAVSPESSWRVPWTERRIGPANEELLALDGLAVFPGRARTGKPVIAVAAAYLPFPLSHGGAVRMFQMMSQARKDFDQVLVAFCDELETPPPELLDLCAEIVMVKRKGTHYRRTSARPDMVEEMDSPAFRAALRQTVKKWHPEVAQLEFTAMAQYAADCRPAKTVLVEHDITFDLHEQLARRQGTWEARQQAMKWRTFERAAWGEVDRVVGMSKKDCAAIGWERAVCLPNGVDLKRYRPAAGEPEPGRVLFIGSFTHLPNLLALEFFLEEVWPLLEDLSPVLHVVAGARHEYYMDFHGKRVGGPRVEMEGFVADVRQAYMRAEVAIAPLTASAGTNIKVLEAMAMGKAVVSTPAGINGLDVSGGVLVEETAAGFAQAVRTCLLDREERLRLGRAAREIVERDYDWERVGRKQRGMYAELIGGGLEERHRVAASAESEPVAAPVHASDGD